MAKKIKFESFIYRFLYAADKIEVIPYLENPLKWEYFLNSLVFKYENNEIGIFWESPYKGNMIIPISEVKFYLRGDSLANIEKQRAAGLLFATDLVKLKNDKYFKELAMRVAESAGYKTPAKSKTTHDERIDSEREFHDAWAESEDVDKIDVIGSNEVCTAPEMRYITKRLGDIKGKRLLDVGCGLGEASVYFALLGAEVTSSDLSQGMLDATTRLAYVNGVFVNQHIASAEDLKLSIDDKFDIIYAGNLLHHVNIEDTLVRIKMHLAPGGVFVSWDPLAYNPAINIYRAMATNVRTPDEHPLKWVDIKTFRKHFNLVETKYFWLTTLIIFVIMALAQHRNPNKERYWKVVVQEGNKWEWLYRPLEKIDEFLLKIFPPLRLWCWNVVIVARQ